MAIIYIAGPMTGLKGFNRDSFHLAAEHLRAAGFEVRNPACLDTDWSNYNHYTDVSLVMVEQADGIVFLPGSSASKGAQMERAKARELRLKNATPLLSGVWDDLEKLYIRNGGDKYVLLAVG